jgi:hypothetical protein
MDIDIEQLPDLPDTRGPKAHYDLLSSLDEYAKVKSETDLLTFVRRTAPTLVTDFKMGRHIELLCDRLQKVA